MIIDIGIMTAEIEIMTGQLVILNGTSNNLLLSIDGLLDELVILNGTNNNLLLGIDGLLDELVILNGTNNNLLLGIDGLLDELVILNTTSNNLLLGIDGLLDELVILNGTNNDLLIGIDGLLDELVALNTTSNNLLLSIDGLLDELVALNTTSNNLLLSIDGLLDELVILNGTNNDLLIGIDDLLDELVGLNSTNNDLLIGIDDLLSEIAVMTSALVYFSDFSRYLLTRIAFNTELTGESLSGLNLSFPQWEPGMVLNIDPSEDIWDLLDIIKVVEYLAEIVSNSDLLIAQTGFLMGIFQNTSIMASALGGEGQTIHSLIEYWNMPDSIVDYYTEAAQAEGGMTKIFDTTPYQTLDYELNEDEEGGAYTSSNLFTASMIDYLKQIAGNTGITAMAVASLESVLDISDTPEQTIYRDNQTAYRQFLYSNFSDWVNAGMPESLLQFAEGGIAEGPMSGYPVELHGTEAVIPLHGGAVPVQLINGGSTNDKPINITLEIDGKALDVKIKSVSDGARVSVNKRPGNETRRVYR